MPKPREMKAPSFLVAYLLVFLFAGPVCLFLLLVTGALVLAILVGVVGGSAPEAIVAAWTAVVTDSALLQVVALTAQLLAVGALTRWACRRLPDVLDCDRLLGRVPDTRSVLVAVTVGAVIGSGRIVPLLTNGASRLADVSSADAASHALGAVVASALAVPAEEIVFRGAVQRVLLRAIPAVPAVFLQAAAFATAHLRGGEAYTGQLVGLTALGVFLGVAALLANSLWVVMLLHLTINIASMGAAQALAPGDPAAVAAYQASGAGIAASASLYVLGLLLLRRLWRPAPSGGA